jgi:hypothetical protein
MEVETERRLISCAGNLDRQDRHPILAEERIERLQQERLEPRGGLRDSSLQAQRSVEIQGLIP